MAVKKNILLLVADDLGRDLSIYGRENSPNTPNLEKLAAQGAFQDISYATDISVELQPFSLRYLSIAC